jgi:hypothetical protein
MVSHYYLDPCHSAGVKQILQDRLLEDDEGDAESQVDFYDRHQNPSYKQLYRLYTVWREEHCGSDDASMINALQARAEELAPKGFNVKSQCFNCHNFQRTATDVN